jgi:hypothetical protein
MRGHTLHIHRGLAHRLPLVYAHSVLASQWIFNRISGTWDTAGLAFQG